ncbi:hypothetical protein B0T25DRAFT_597942 [Lasiosphaeria hispida]|uniref:Uncharacterized protein n=1 Tax=Lasiosphaeria hispida TaxID=260671 RepID=A0AAJ0MKS9_9PEZI|nr:hypothetical protein B0T25DRAFT_597942 [Lasiosphaeria hispida]
MDLRTERGAPYESAENDVAVEESAERNSPQPESGPRSHAALLSDLAQLTEADHGFFRDQSFLVTPDQFWDFQEANDADEFPCKLGRYDYDGTTLYFKNMTRVHGGISGKAALDIYREVVLLESHVEVGAIARDLRLRMGWPVHISSDQFREPDFAFGMSGADLPGFVGEVNYSRRFTRQQLEAKYQAYLTDAISHSSDARDKVHTVMCVDLYYAGTGVKTLKTATELHRSAISIWILRDGTVETAEGARIDLYLSDFVGDHQELPAEFVRPHNGPGWPPTIHIPFASLISDLEGFCRIDAAKPLEPRKRKRQDKSDEELKGSDKTMAKMREMECKIGEMEAKKAAEDRDLRAERRDAARDRQKLARAEQEIARLRQQLSRS